MIDDLEAGVAITSLNAWVDDIAIIVNGGLVQIDKKGSAYIVFYQPVVSFAEDSTVSVHVTFSDMEIIPNGCDSTWTFTIGNTTRDTSTMISMLIGAEGGTIRNDSLNVTMIIPENMFEDTVQISISKIDSLPPLPEGQQVIGLNYHFGPDGLVANVPILVAIPYTQNDLDSAGVSNPADLEIDYFHSFTKTWSQLKIDHADEPEMLIYVQVNEFCFLTFTRNPESIIAAAEIDDDNSDATEMLTTAVENGNSQPSAFALHQNYPNPFNPETNIRFDVRESVYVVLKVYNLLGYKVATLADKTYQAGTYTLQFNALNLPSGVYFYQIQMGDYKAMHRMMVLE